MKSLQRSSFIALAVVLLLAACSTDSEKSKGESRISGRAGVAVGSADPSRLTPGRPGLSPAN